MCLSGKYRLTQCHPYRYFGVLQWDLQVFLKVHLKNIHKISSVREKHSVMLILYSTVPSAAPTFVTY